MAETPPPHPTPLPPPRPPKRGIEWPVVLILAIVLFTVAGLVLNLAGLFR